MSGNLADWLKGHWDWKIPDKGVCKTKNKVCEQSSAITHMVSFFLTTSTFRLRSSKQIKLSLIHTHSFLFFSLLCCRSASIQSSTHEQANSRERFRRRSELPALVLSAGIDAQLSSGFHGAGISTSFLFLQPDSGT